MHYEPSSRSACGTCELTKYASGSVLDEWFENGVLVRPYTNDQDVYDLLKIVAGEPAVPSPPYDWAERRITSVKNDPQGRAHVDSFASVVKVWLFDDVGEDAGPLHVVRGSHRHTLDRLAWEHARANGREALIEPSFRLTSNESDAGDAAAFVARCQRDAAPIVTQKPIVVVADTSLVHFRGAGRVGAVRRSRRLRGDNGGGLVQRNRSGSWTRGNVAVIPHAEYTVRNEAPVRARPAAPPPRRRISSLLQNAKRTSGLEGSSVKKGDAGMATTPCSAASHRQKAQSAATEPSLYSSGMSSISSNVSDDKIPALRR